VVLYYTYWRTEKRHKLGYMFGLFMIFIWGIRFIMEYFKSSQGGFETAFNNVLSTGQLLSIPFVLIGIYFVLRRSPVQGV
jgi:prolipoprotein diacylglyceryltransferase